MKLSEKQKVQFLKEVEETGLERIAAKRIGLPFGVIKDAMKEHADFADEVNEAILEFKADAEYRFYDMALNGIEQEVYSREGTYTGTRRVISEKFTMELMKAIEPEKYSDKKQITGAKGGPVEFVLRNFDEEEDDLPY